MNDVESPAKTEREILPLRQRRAVVLLLSTPPAAVAAELGVQERQVYRWLATPAFQRELADAERKVLDATTRHLSGLALLAVDALQKALTDVHATPAAKVRAACAVLGLVQEWQNWRTLDERIRRLEERQNNVT